MGHAIDYNYGIDNGKDGFYSHFYQSNGKTLKEHMYEDVENRIRAELKRELEKPKYNDMEDHIKMYTISNVVEAFIYEEEPPDIQLTSEERSVYNAVQRKLRSDLRTDEDNNASDVYGGVTVNEIKGRWRHDVDYWIDEDDTLERINEPNKEGFASYYGSMMIENGDFRDDQLASHDYYLPESKEHMDEMFERMSEGGGE